MDQNTLIKLLDCQKTDGSWKFVTHLDELIGINSDKCLEILYQSGLKSLGKTVKHNIKCFLATPLVLYSILELVQIEIDLEFLLSLWDRYMQANHGALRLENKMLSSTAVNALRRAMEFCTSIDEKYPMVPSTLELGPSWCHVLYSMMN